MRDKNGRKYDLKNYVEKVIHGKYFIKVSAYHGGDLEGNSIRRYMENGNRIFDKVELYLL